MLFSTGKVFAVERLGNETYVYLDVPGSSEFAVHAAGDVAVKPGDDAAVGLPAKDCHLFDAKVKHRAFQPGRFRRTALPFRSRRNGPDGLNTCSEAWSKLIAAAQASARAATRRLASARPMPGRVVLGSMPMSGRGHAMARRRVPPNSYQSQAQGKRAASQESATATALSRRRIATQAVVEIVQIGHAPPCGPAGSTEIERARSSRQPSASRRCAPGTQRIGGGIIAVVDRHALRAGR